MSDILPSELANSIMGKLYDILTNGDDTVPKSEDNFFSWCTPGIPIDIADFEFLSQGFTGALKKPAMELVTAGGGGTGAALTQAQIDQLLAQDSGRLYQQAEMFARMVDFVPDTSGINKQFQTLNVMNNEGGLSERYEYILRFSQVLDAELPADVVAKIASLRDKLYVTKKKKDLIDDSEIEVQEPGPVLQAYNEKLKAYEDAALEYNCHRINALAASTPEAVHYFPMNAPILRNRVNAAKSDWIAGGYKNDVEKISAYLDSVQQRDMTLLKAEYKDALDKAKLTGIASGSDFYWTGVAPAKWAESSGWTTYTFESNDIHSYQHSSYNKWGGGASFFGIGASVSGSHNEYQGKFDSQQFRLEFKITQVPILRPWFKTQFLTSKSWRMDQSNPEAKSEMVSDGKTPPNGMIPAYPTMLLAVKDLKLTLGNVQSTNSFVQDQISAGGFASFGPFSIGGSYSRGSSTSQFDYHSDGQGIAVPGMQIIGFKCHVLPMSPDPLPSITKWA